MFTPTLPISAVNMAPVDPHTFYLVFVGIALAVAAVVYFFCGASSGDYRELIF